MTSDATPGPRDLEDQDATAPDRESDFKKTRTFGMGPSITAAQLPKNTGKRKKTRRRAADSKIVGLKNYGLEKSVYKKRHHLHQNSDEGRISVSSPAILQCGNDRSPKGRFSVEEKEEEVRRTAARNPYVLFYLGNLAALKVLLYYLSKSQTLLHLDHASSPKHA